MSLGLKSCGLSLESTLSFGNPPINVLVLPLAAVLALPASYHHPDYITQPTNDKRDTSMTATMLLQDSMLKPSVFRSASEIQERSHSPGCPSLLHKCVQILEGWISTDHKKITRTAYRHKSGIHSNYDAHKYVLRFAMILFRMFISSDGLTSMSYMTISKHVNTTEAAETCTRCWEKHSWRSKGSHSTHFPSKLLEDSAKLFLLITLVLLCIYSWPAWWRLREQETTKFRVNRRAMVS